VKPMDLKSNRSLTSEVDFSPAHSSSPILWCSARWGRRERLDWKDEVV
jgi:hypothetical protein